MYPVTDRFKEAIKVSHQMATKATVTDASGTVLTELDISAGNVTMDKTAENRRRASVTLHTQSLVASDVGDILHPLSGNEVRLYRGIRFGDGTEELVPQGVFGIQDVAIEDTGQGISITPKLFDRSKDIQRKRFTEPYFITEGTNVVTAIQDLISSRIATTQFNVTTPTDETTPPLVYGVGRGGGDPWEAVGKLAESIGYEVYFDGDGVCVIRPEPDPKTSSVVWEYHEGPDNLMLFLTKSITKEGVYNHVIAFAVGSSLTSPIRVDVYDDDPNSPTWIEGPFGDIPTWLPTNMILNTTQAEDAARAKLNKVIGAPEKIRFISIVNPAHEPGDIVSIQRARLNVSSQYIIDKIALPMDVSGSLNIDCREQQGTLS